MFREKFIALHISWRHYISMFISTPLLISFLDNLEKCTRKSRERELQNDKTKDRMRFYNYFRSFDRFQGNFVNVNKFAKLSKFDVSFSQSRDMTEAFHFLTASKMENNEQETIAKLCMNYHGENISPCSYQLLY